ncbi:hypothetical protein IV203_026725 [Nitzschia inconspicua]|uniref:Poly(A) RNA polymerase mitochondrial-like central palm domain-containing protein n=1 Tax=Nitzschia inconspicua TaxID=303405 RepID=A0A9K3LJ50_9STRA|nr:hypothetical protein IV203_026725 [Nitzschia inconspicua]
MREPEATTEATKSSAVSKSPSPPEGAETTGSTVRSSKNEPSPNFQQNVRQWFNSLSVEDRAAALGFTDGPWLMLWTRLVASTTEAITASSSEAAISAPLSRGFPQNSSYNIHSCEYQAKEGKPNTRTTDRLVSSSFDWQATVTLKDVEQIWKEITNGCSSNTPEATIADEKAVFASRSANEEENKGSSDAVVADESSQDATSDAYRISGRMTEQTDDVLSNNIATPIANQRHSEDGKIDIFETENVGGKPEIPAEAQVEGQQTCHSINGDSKKISSSIVLEPESMEEIPSENKATATHRKQVAFIMNNVFSIFPSAMNYITYLSHTSKNTTTAGTTTISTSPNNSSLVPFITLNTAYIASISGEDLLSAFDEIVLATYSCAGTNKEEVFSFIPRDKSHIAFMIDFLKKMASTHGEPLQASTAVPLYMVILIRFRSSLLEAYQSKLSESTSNVDNFSVSKPFGNKEALFFKQLEQLEQNKQIASNDVVVKLQLKFPDVVERIDCTKNMCIQRFVLLPLMSVTRRLIHAIDLDSHLGVLRLIDEVFVSCLGEGDGPPLDSQEHGFTSQKAFDDDLEAIVAELDAPRNGLEISSNGPGGIGNKKLRKKKRKKKKNRGCGAGTNMAKQSQQDDHEKPKEIEKTDIGETDPHTEEFAVIDTCTILSQSVPSLSDTAMTNKLIEDPSHIGLKGKGKSRAEDDSSYLVVVPPNADTENNFQAASVKQSDAKLENVVEDDDNCKVEDGVWTSRECPQAETLISTVEQDPESRIGEVGEKIDESQIADLPKDPSGDDEDQWETVGARPRDRRKKLVSNGQSASQQHASYISSFSGQQSGTKKKAGNRSDARRRNKNRRIVKEILGSLLDKVDEEVKTRSLSRDLRRNDTTGTVSASRIATSQSQISPIKHMKPSSMRDVLMSGSRTLLSDSLQSSAGRVYADRSNAAKQQSGACGGSSAASKDEKIFLHAIAGKVLGSPADQNTVPTIPETLSTAPPRQKSRGNDSSSGDSLEAQKSQNPPTNTKDSSPSPPLPTLLSPGNNNSSSSSVASSLDAPHGSLPDPTENEVGYHLLGVCKRLSEEIALFMRRREDALSVRRHERRLVLTALEDTLGSIWPGLCSVEMYGSCATNLDLPSSDLDVVVCGLDRPFGPAQSHTNKRKSVTSMSLGDISRTADDGTQKEGGVARVSSKQEIFQFNNEQQQFPQQQLSLHRNVQIMYPQISPNAERVMRLAVELEHQPWAVHVKAIPTATVPVIKILADPARLSGTIDSSSDWLVQHSISPHGTSEKDSKNVNQSPIAHYPTAEAPPLWRGADVVNGLLKVDITFEGPEHGGIGSTKFSTRAVEEFAAEKGLVPEATPAVQVLMVLKELLAQRRLNEPFSGGLSSYALLLLVISVIKERSIIREELEKAERQRRVVAAGGGNSALGSPEKSKKTKEAPLKHGSSNLTEEQTALDGVDKKDAGFTKPGSANSKERMEQRKEIAGKKIGSASNSPKPARLESDTRKSQGKPVKSSWASIARQHSSSGSLHQPRPQEPSKEIGERTAPSNAQSLNRKELKKPSSFADAVAKGVSASRPISSLPETKTKSEDSHNIEKTKKNGDEKITAPFSEKNGSCKTVQGESKENGNNFNAEKVTGHGSPPHQAVTSLNSNDRNGSDSPVFPQGFHDVVEVLCSGETTPGKLLLHFLLFYGQHFDSQSTAIDFSGTHQRDINGNQGYSMRSPYMQRRSAGTYDPVTGMLTVDPIVVYDPLEGAENNNVARSCFAWSSIRWLFAQSYMTLSSTVETNAIQGNTNRSTQSKGDGPAYGHDQSGKVVVDPNSPLLELLLSY